VPAAAKRLANTAEAALRSQPCLSILTYLAQPQGNTAAHPSIIQQTAIAGKYGLSPQDWPTNNPMVVRWRSTKGMAWGLGYAFVEVGDFLQKQVCSTPLGGVDRSIHVRPSVAGRWIQFRSLWF
jgi:hypothetical protein